MKPEGIYPSAQIFFGETKSHQEACVTRQHRANDGFDTKKAPPGVVPGRAFFIQENLRQRTSVTSPLYSNTRPSIICISA